MADVLTSLRRIDVPAAFTIAIARLREMTVNELQARYAEVFGEPARSRNKPYLWKRIAYRLQEQQHGGLSPRARTRLEELRDRVPLAFRRPGATSEVAVRRDPRLPPPGHRLVRAWKGIRHEVTVLDDGFEYAGERYRSLSAIARRITGTPWNGFTFFGLAGEDAGR
jgi:hypothetical protein